MKKFHLHLGVKDLEESVSFYQRLFQAKPTKLKTDYAQWVLDDPDVNFAISTRTTKIGLDHLGIQLSHHGQLDALREDLQQAEIEAHQEGEVTCCYAQADKSWVTDPDGMAWETYYSMKNAQTYHGEAPSCCLARDAACC